VAGERPGWSRGRGLSPDRAARAILSGLERRKPEVVPGWQAKGYAWLAHWMPGLIDRWAAARWRTDASGTGGTGDGHAR
jgi:short-subunit dehydrogenase